MSFEPDTNDIVLRQLREEIAKIREEQFVSALPTNNIGSASPVNSSSGIPIPTTGIDSTLPLVIFTTKDTGVIDLLDFDSKNPNKDFTIGETITGQLSGATAEIGDIDTLTDTTGILTLVPGSITGTFSDGENLNGSVGGTNIADADGSQYTQTGRGHLNAGAGSIIASSENVTAPFEIHFIDNAEQDGQIIYLRALEGQTIRMRRSLSFDGTTGNLDLDESFDIVENALVFFQYQVASNISETGGWVPLITNVVAGGSGGVFQFPILYPREDLGTQNGVIDLSLNQSDGHYKKITLDGDASLTFSNLPPNINGFKFYVETTQDGTGGWVYTDLPDSVLFESTLLGRLQTAPNAKTLWQFSTVDGGVNWHANVIDPTAGAGDSQTPWLSDIDADNFDLFNANQIRFSGSGNPFSCPTDSTVLGMAGSIIGLEWNVPLTGSYFWLHACKQFMKLERTGANTHELTLFDEGSVERARQISFTHLVPIPALSNIRPDGLQLKYETGHGSGQGAFHGFNVGFPAFPQFEIREDVVRSNVDLDMITNDINNVDQIQFDGSGGFEPLINHGERRITGGAQGIEMNIPKISPFAGGFNIWFENNAQTASDLIFRFEKGRLFLPNCATIESSLGYFLCNGGSIQDTITRVIFTTGQNPNPPNDPQILELAVSNQKKVEFTNLEDGSGGVGGGMKMFTDLNMQTQNINNVDVLDFEVDSGVDVGGAPNGTNNIVAFNTSTLLHGLDPTFLFNIPSGLPSSQIAWSKSHQIFLTGDTFSLHMHATGDTDIPLLIADGGFKYGASHLPAFNPLIDGESRLINNSGSFDVVYRTGGKLVNLSDLTATGGLDIDNDLGTVGSQAVEIDWDVSNFHRMIVDGDITVGMNNLPNAGEWQEITVQFQQDGIGGNEVNFIDVFTNGVQPRISKGANKYTAVKFYSYNDGFERVLAFNILGQHGVDPWYQGICLARMATDQQANTAVGNHLEFDTNEFSDRITVSGGSGQSKGIFSGFVGGRTYECVCHFAVENVAGTNAPASMTVQWFDRATSTFLGVPGTATDIIIPENQQQTAVAYFIPANDGDTLDCRIISNNGDVDGVKSGVGLTTTINIPASKVTIKDCGISEGEFNSIVDEDLPPSQIPPPPPPIGFSARGFHYNSYVFFNIAGIGDNGSHVVPIDGENLMMNPTIPPTEPVGSTGKAMAGTSGRWRNTSWKLSQNTLNKDMVVTIMEDDNELSTLFTIPAGATGTFSSGSAPQVVFGRRYWYKFESIDNINPTGRLSMSVATEIRWGFAD